MKKESQVKTEILRQKSTDLLEKQSKKASSQLEGEFLKLIHELQVHKVELEMQNEDLLKANVKKEIATRKYTTFYDFAPIGYFTLSGDGTINELNLMGAAMLGKVRSEAINRRFSVFISDNTKAVFNLFLTQIFSGTAQESCEVTLTPNGSAPIDVTLIGIAVVDEDKCLLTAVDITGRNKKEELQKQSENILNEIQAVANLGTYKFEMATDKWESSEMLDAILGITPDFERSFKGWTSVIHPDWQELMADYFYNEVIGKKEKFDKEYKIIRQNDKVERWVHGTGRIILNDKDQSLFLVGSIRDITRQKQDEEKIKLKNRNLVDLNAEKNKFFSIIAHDLRSPFTVLMGYSLLMDEDFETLTTDELQEMARTMRKSADSLFHLLENLLEWSRMQCGLLSFNPESFLVRDLVVSCIELVTETAAKKKIHINYDIPEYLTLTADIQMVGSLMRNLVFNALKFTTTGGAITIAAVQMPDHTVAISVADTGIGMSNEIMDNLFVLDNSSHRTGTEGEPSTGLGLIMCKDYIEKHGGTISVVSKVGAGSTFLLTIPCLA